jgi:hypothetical protein
MQLTTTCREEDRCKLPVANWHCLAARSPEPDPAEAGSGPQPGVWRCAIRTASPTPT